MLYYPQIWLSGRISFTKMKAGTTKKAESFSKSHILVEKYFGLAPNTYYVKKLSNIFLLLNLTDSNMKIKETTVFVTSWFNKRNTIQQILIPKNTIYRTRAIINNYVMLVFKSGFYSRAKNYLLERQRGRWKNQQGTQLWK